MNTRIWLIISVLAVPLAAATTAIGNLPLVTAKRISDLNPGSADGFMYGAANFVEFQNTLYFQANDGVHGRELWKYNGHAFSLAADISVLGGRPAETTVFQNMLYFRADDEDHGKELWRFDGTTATLVVDLLEGPSDSVPRGMTVFDGQLYFSAYNGTSTVLFRHDAKANATFSEVELAGSGVQGPPFENAVSLFEHQEYLYFGGRTDAQGAELYRYRFDSVEALGDFRPGSSGSFPRFFTSTPFDDAIYFSAISEQGSGLARYDPNTNDTRMHTIFGSTPTFSATLDTQVVFVVNEQLWRLQDGDVSQISPENDFKVSFRSPLVTIDSWVYFVAEDFEHGHAIWRYGENNGLMLFALLPARDLEHEDNFMAEDLFVFNGQLYFTARSSGFGRELWTVIPEPSAIAGVGVALLMLFRIDRVRI